MHKITLVNAHTTRITESNNSSGSLVLSHTVLTIAHCFTRLLMHSMAARSACNSWPLSFSSSSSLTYLLTLAFFVAGTTMPSLPL